MNLESAENNISGQTRIVDYDRYLCALFAPSNLQQSIFTIILFNAEIARVWDNVSEPMLGAIRFQWWRESIQNIYSGNVNDHYIIRLLAKVIKRHNLSYCYFERLIYAREQNFMETMPATVVQLEKYAEETSSPILALFVEIAGHASALKRPEVLETIRYYGIAWSLMGLTRSIPFHERRYKMFIPREIFVSLGVPDDQILDSKGTAYFIKAVTQIGDLTNSYVCRGKNIDIGRKSFMKQGYLLGALTELYYNRLRKCRYDPYNRKMQISPLRRQVFLSIISLRIR